MSNENMTWQEVCKKLLRFDNEGHRKPWEKFLWTGGGYLGWRYCETLDHLLAATALEDCLVCLNPHTKLTKRSRTMSKIDINKQYQTKAGHDVQIFTTGAPEPYPVVGIVYQGLYGWEPAHWTAHGEDKSDLGYDLVEVKPKRLVYVNLYRFKHDPQLRYTMHGFAEGARDSAMPSAIAVAVPVYIEEEE